MDDHDAASITIELDLHRSDIVAGERSLARRPEVRSFRRASVGAQFVAMFGFATLALTGGRGGAAAAAVLLAAHYFLVRLSETRWGELFLQPARSLTFDELGYTTTTAGVVSRVPWTALIDIELTGDLIVVRLVPALVEVWPRRCFGPGDDERVLAWAQSARQSRPG